jgi:Tol biopolymer transport system component
VIATLAGTARADDTKLLTTLDGTTTLGGSLGGMSRDGRFFVFNSDSGAFVAGDDNGVTDVFLEDRQLGTFERVNIASDGTQDDSGTSAAYGGSISDDGRFVLFFSRAKLDSADISTAQDLYVRDRASGTTTLVSKRNGGGLPLDVYEGVISSDGTHVFFGSSAGNLVGGDWDQFGDVFEWDAATDSITMVSTYSDGKSINYPCSGAVPSADAQEFAFTLRFGGGDVSHGQGTYVKNVATGLLERVDLDSTGTGYAQYSYLTGMSPDGRFVLFNTGDALVPDDTNHVTDGYVRDRQLGTTERVTFGAGYAELPTYSTAIGMSDDARRILVHSSFDLTSDDHNFKPDDYVFDRDTGALLLVTLGPDGGQQDVYDDFFWGFLSPDGHRYVFRTISDSVWPGDSNGTSDVFERDLSDIDAAWTNYGDGFSGRFGEPSIALSALPRRSLDVSLTIGNSSGLYSVVALLIGVASQSLPTNLGGTLLVQPLEVMVLPITPFGSDYPFTVPPDGDLPGVHVYLQALELDPWAAKGVSFTPGLDATIGD